VCVSSWLVAAAPITTLSLPETDPGADEEGGNQTDIEYGDEVRLTLQDGRKVKATVVEIGTQSLIVRGARIEGSVEDTPSEIGEPALAAKKAHTKYLFSEIYMLEKYESNKGSDITVLVLVVGGLALFAIAGNWSPDWDFD
jgi:hypothetical protein